MKSYKGKKILVTGGLGFIGSSLAIALVKNGGTVTIVDNLVPTQGGNLFNIESIKSNVTVNYTDIRDVSAINQLVKDKDIIFHLARQTDHILSQTDPFPDIDVNIKGTAILLEACKLYNPSTRFIFVGTRGQYGKAVTIPVKETAPTNPKGIYELTNLTGEKMVQIYNDNYGIPSVMLRLTNVYGSRAQMKTHHYGVVNWFIRQALDNECISVFGDGTLKRDFLYIDDAVDAILQTAIHPSCTGEIFNVGNPQPYTFLVLVQTIIDCSGTGSYRFTPFSKERLMQDPGDFASDITKITKFTGWKPTTALQDGIKKTIVYYKKYKEQYWE